MASLKKLQLLAILQAKQANKLYTNKLGNVNAQEIELLLPNRASLNQEYQRDNMTQDISPWFGCLLATYIHVVARLTWWLMC